MDVRVRLHIIYPLSTLLPAELVWRMPFTSVGSPFDTNFVTMTGDWIPSSVRTVEAAFGLLPRPHYLYWV